MKLPKQLESRIKALKKFFNKIPESNFINNGFYTNDWMYIKDDTLIEIPQEFRIIDSKKEHKKILNKVELDGKLKIFKEQKYSVKKLTKQEFTKFFTDFKRFNFEQIKIQNGHFILFDNTGHIKWKCRGFTEYFKDINLEFDFKLLLNIFNYLSEIGADDITIYSSKTFLVIKARAQSTITLYSRGVVLEEVNENSFK